MTFIYYTVMSMLTGNLRNVVIAAVGTFVFYSLNQRQNWYYLSDVQYVVIFVALALSMTILDSYQGFSAHEAVHQTAQTMGLVDNPVLKEALPTDHGQQVDSCYGVPYKVIRTQYGDRGLLAGYNEYVEAHQQGGINQPAPDHRIYTSCMADETQGIKEEVTDVPAQ
jgi:hypothetical protein